MVDYVLELNPDLVITEKGISGAPLRLCRVLIADCSPTSNRLCAVLLRLPNVSALRRVRKSDKGLLATSD
jgi:hypothetical protein